MDVGCGAGVNYEVLRSVGRASAYVGVDSSEPSIEIARELYPTGDFRVGNATALTTQFGTHSFDVVIVRHVLEHLPGFELAMDQATAASRRLAIFVLYLSPRSLAVRRPQTRPGTQSPDFLCWGWHADPLVFSYCFTVRPGMIKGWGLHKKHDDRYFILFGEMETVLYDDRPDSPTRGLVAKVVISEYRRRLMNIPAGVWHANRNLGVKDVVVINFPTIQYDHANPDKYRLPLDNDYIPYKFDDLRGW